MEQYQNQYGAATISKDPVQQEMETTGDTTGVGFGGGGGGGSTQVIAEDYDTRNSNYDNSNSNNSGEKQKKGIIEKIKEKLPGTGTHQHK
ncbi:water stress-inducible protein Rab21-like [Vigna unguiculata]|nr:water stress-inducible protein Rab21-like [Vigna unguiculata]